MFNFTQRAIGCLLNFIRLRSIVEMILLSTLVILLLASNHLSINNESGNLEKTSPHSTIFGFVYRITRPVVFIAIKFKRIVLFQNNNNNNIKVLTNKIQSPCPTSSPTPSVSSIHSYNTETYSSSHYFNDYSKNTAIHTASLMPTIQNNLHMHSITYTISPSFHYTSTVSLHSVKASDSFNQNTFLTVHPSSSKNPTTDQFVKSPTTQIFFNHLTTLSFIHPSTNNDFIQSPTTTSFTNTAYSFTDSFQTQNDFFQTQTSFTDSFSKTVSATTFSQEFTKSFEPSSISTSYHFSQTAPPEFSPDFHPSIKEHADPIDADKINDRLNSIDFSLYKHKSEMKDILFSVSKNFDDLVYSHESEVDIFLDHIDDDDGEVRHFYHVPSKFTTHFENVPLPKGSNGMWEAKGGTAEFTFCAPSLSIINKIAFDLIPNNKCTVRDFYLKVGVDKMPEIASKKFSLKQNIMKRQNFSLPFAVKFNYITLKTISNYGNSTHVCLPEFRVFQRIGFHSY